jgi:hypothetical protein
VRIETGGRSATRRVQVADLTPPAAEHTLFIHGEGTEWLRAGSFTLRNLTLPADFDGAVRGLLQRVSPGVGAVAAADAVDHVSRELSLGARVDSPALMGRIQRLVATPGLARSDNAMKDFVDNRVLKLDPRTWGRVRTNGVLHVYPPLWTTDDVINYVADRPLLGQALPEIGYPGCDNRLHDPYMSVYTHYEGDFYKTYRRLGASMKTVAPQRYTINTRMNFVKRCPERAPVPNLERLAGSASSLAARVLADGAVLEGTAEEPLELGGIWYAAGRVTLGGRYRGRGLIVAAGDVIISRSLEPSAAGSRLGIASLGGAVRVGDGHHVIRAYVYARAGLKGPRPSKVRVIGNLVVETLDRDRMPGTFACWFDPSFVDGKTGPVSAVLLD